MKSLLHVVLERDEMLEMAQIPFRFVVFFDMLQKHMSLTKYHYYRLFFVNDILNPIKLPNIDKQ
jgi:hypothetical protein